MSGISVTQGTPILAPQQATAGCGPHALTINEETFGVNEVVSAAVLELGSEVDRLRALVENAPHGDECPDRFSWRDDATLPCTCWKAEAL